MSVGLIKLSRIGFQGIFVTVCFLLILLLPKQISAKKKLTKQRKHKNGSKANPTFYRHFIDIYKHFIDPAFL